MTRAKKERITMSLSRESVRYLRGLRAEVQSPSMSALFESIVADLRRKAEMEQLEARTQAYYDSLQKSDIQEQSDWGVLGESALESQTNPTGLTDHDLQNAGAKR
jgi:hypothetical protein